MRELRSEINIASPPSAVWKVLTDFPSFPNWNPFIREASGSLKVGERLRVRSYPPGGRAMTFRPKGLGLRREPRAAVARAPPRARAL